MDFLEIEVNHLLSQFQAQICYVNHEMAVHRFLFTQARPTWCKLLLKNPFLTKISLKWSNIYQKQQMHGAEDTFT